MIRFLKTLSTKLMCMLFLFRLQMHPIFVFFFNFWQIRYDFLGPAAFAHNFSWIGLPLRYGVVYFCGRDYGLRLNTLQNGPLLPAVKQKYPGKFNDQESESSRVG